MKTEAQSDRGSADRKGRAIKKQSVSTPHPCHIGHSRKAWIPSLGAGGAPFRNDAAAKVSGENTQRYPQDRNPGPRVSFAG